MPDRKIPCARCESEKKHLERSGFWEVVSCTPIAHKDGRCKLVYRRKRCARPTT